MIRTLFLRITTPGALVPDLSERPDLEALTGGRTPMRQGCHLELAIKGHKYSWYRGFDGVQPSSIYPRSSPVHHRLGTQSKPRIFGRPSETRTPISALSEQRTNQLYERPIYLVFCSSLQEYYICYCHQSQPFLSI